MNFNLARHKQLIWLCTLAVVALFIGAEYQSNGITAIVIIALLTLICIVAKVLNLQQQTDNELAQIFKALANNDPTLGLPQSSPWAAKIAQVRQQVQDSRIEAETQAQFLQSLLLHLDQAILVINENNDVVDKNPACARLLGRQIDNLAQLDLLGELISSTNKSHRATVSWQIAERQDTLSVHISCCDIQGKTLKLVSIQSIYQALMIKEQQAYKQLTKVLTHEVANSITPLSSLAQTAQTLIPEQLFFEDEEDKADLTEVLLTIANRTTQLNSFIRSFNQITSLPAPDLKEIDLDALVRRVLTLFKTQAATQNIQLTFDCEAHYLLMADAAQIEQTIINIIKNSLDAVTDAKHKKVALTLYQKILQNGRQQLILDIEDFGPGVTPHVVEQIFVPFFTTKKSGSGIGLSLSRQIMLQHGGDLIYISNPKPGACFRLSFGLF